MKYRRSDFLAAEDAAIVIDEQYGELDESLFENTPVVCVEDCSVSGELHYDGKRRVVSDLNISGTMVMEDSITGEDLEVPFETESETVYSFEPDNEEDVVVVLQDTIDLTDEIIQAIVYEAPMSITRLAREEYPTGNGWTLLSDQDPQEDTQEDPRWAKLKEFQIEDD